MDFRQGFTLGLVLRVALLVLAVAAFAASVMATGLYAVRIVAGLLVALAVFDIWRFVRRTNGEVARFIEALQHADFSASFATPRAGSGFDRLGDALTSAIRKLRDERGQQGDQARFYEAVVDDLPVALLTVDAGQRVTRANKAARQLFTDVEGVRPEDFARYGGALLACLTKGNTDEQVIQLQFDDGPQRALVRSGRVSRLGGSMQAIAIQPIQGALNAVELAAQSDLVRVLTHEIMNSMTPVTSLAHTAVQLMAAADESGDRAAITDAREAVDTLARRADGVIHFVGTYRQISRPPELRRSQFTARALADQLAVLFAADWPEDRARLTIRITPHDLVIDADRDLLSQMLINLLRNGAEAASEVRDMVEVGMHFSARGGALVRIDVTDNGPGIAEPLRKEVFLPFFTTKAKGTGVGLSLARQIVLAHAGTIEISDMPESGCQFTIIL